MAAQYYRNQGYWRKSRLQFALGVGTSNFLGELGGRDRVGSDFIWDLETKQFKPAFSVGMRYFIKPKLALRFQGSYAVLSGDDALTEERFRSNRNLHFKSPLYEVSLILEANIHTVRPGHRYNLSGVRGKKPRAANIYAFAGIGGIHFNPKGLYINGGQEVWEPLRPLGTEGQNVDLNDDNEPYSQYSIVIPMGIGYRTKMKGPMMLGIEIGHRMTFTDYIDDVSTSYYGTRQQLNNDPNVSPLAAYFSDPSLQYYIDESGETVPEIISYEGEQRGDETDNDAFLFAQLTMSYKFSSKPYRKRRPSKKKGRRVVF
jgi:hypothetical protein